MTRNIKWEKQYYIDNRERIIEKSKEWQGKNKERRNARRRELTRLGLSKKINKKRTNIKYKLDIILYYGGMCECCKEKNISFLTVDHIKNNGNEHKMNGKNRYKGETLYRYLIKHNYPKGIQILCFNCNIGKHNNKNVCPHKK
jgi:hypothetical protein